MLEIPALLRERSKHSAKLHLHESPIYRQNQQVRRSSSKDRAPRCLCSHLCASARLLLRGSPSLRGAEAIKWIETVELPLAQGREIGG
ncbi:uncharacterized protein LJ206_002549 isoform 2-T2 [Theristicus caerulescens]